VICQLESEGEDEVQVGSPSQSSEFQQVSPVPLLFSGGQTAQTEDAVEGDVVLAGIGRSGKPCSLRRPKLHLPATPHGS
jgi:hypothetical protein